MLIRNHTTKAPTITRKVTEVPFWLIPCYSIILLFAIVGNLLVISTLVQNRRMRTITNVFLLNLAISDILLGVFCMPVTLVGTLLRQFIFGEFFCKLIQFSEDDIYNTEATISASAFPGNPNNSHSATTTNPFINPTNSTTLSNATTMLIRNHTTKAPTITRKVTEVPFWLIPCYSIILLFAIVGNLLVISTLVQNRRMRTITNVFLLNLAISDILLGVFCMPVTLVGTLLRQFIFGEFFCKLIQFSQAASVAVSSWTLVAISCERYYAICHPLRSRSWQTINHANKIIACIWFGSIICMTPIAIFSQLVPTRNQGYHKCREVWPPNTLGYERSYNLFLDLVLLVLPLMILCFTYFLITRTLYISMRNERAMIFGSSYNANSNTRPLASTTTMNIVANNRGSFNRTISFHANTRNNTNGSQSRYGTLGTCSHVNCGGDSSGYFGDSESNSTENEITLQQEIQQNGKNKRRNKQFKQQQYTQQCCENCSSCTGSKKKLIASYNGRHIYCMRSPSTKSSKRNENNRKGFIYNTNIGTVNSTQTVTTNVRCGPSPSPSMTVINLPQQQRFQLHQERRKSNSTPSLRLSGASILRRSNESKSLESKRRVVKMLFVLVLEFFICWTPLYVINTLTMFLGPVVYEYIDYTSISFLQLLAYSSSCCNPITYCFMNANFRRAFVDTFKGMRWSERTFCKRRYKKDTNLSIAGNSIALANSVMSTHTYLESPRL